MLDLADRVLAVVPVKNVLIPRAARMPLVSLAKATSLPVEMVAITAHASPSPGASPSPSR